MNTAFTFIDFLVVAAIIISAGYAAYRGLMSETLTIFAWAAAAFATLYFGPWLVPMARSMIAAHWLAPAIAYSGVFLVVFIPLSFMSHRFSQSVKNSPIGPLDRGLGIAFGVVRGLIVVGLAYLAFTYFTPIRQQPQWLLASRTLPIMQSTAQVLLSVIPNQTPRDYITAAPAPSSYSSPSNDRVGDLIRRQNEGARTAAVPSRPAAKKDEKAYGATDRRALDRLFETTGGSGKQ